jgi:hypothetical protein
MFRISGQKERSAVDDLLAQLEYEGVRLDREFGIVPLDVSESGFLIRGDASDEVIEIIRDKYPVEIFRDDVIGTLSDKAKE